MDLILLILSFFVGCGAVVSILVLSERRALSIVREKANAKGRAVQEEEADEVLAFMGEALAKWQASDKNVQSFMLNEVPPLIGKYPRVAFKYGRKIEKMLMSKIENEMEAS